MKAMIAAGRQPATQQPVIDKEELIAEAETRIENKKAWNDFVESNKAFADPASEERRYGDYLFDTVYSPLIAAGQISYREALTKTGEDVKRVFAGTAQHSSRQQKEERKRGIDNLPIAAGARSVPQKTGPQSVDDTLDAMRRARGQAV